MLSYEMCSSGQEVTYQGVSCGYKTVLQRVLVWLIVADCCDGSDESKVVCKNVCLEQGAQERQVIRDKVAQMQTSLHNKAQLITEGRQRLESWAARSPTISNDIEAAQAEIKQLEGTCWVCEFPESA